MAVTDARRRRRRAAKAANKTWRSAVLYARISPRPGESESINAQFDMMLTWCEANGMSVLWVYWDEFASGKDTNRPYFQEALTHACDEGAVLVTFTQARLSRSLQDVDQIVAQLEECNAAAHVISGIGPSIFDTNWRFVSRLMALIDENAREMIGDTTAQTMLTYQKNGRSVGGKPPYGKRRVPNGPDSSGKLTYRLEDDAGERLTLAYIRKLYVEDGLTAWQIAEQLNKMLIEHPPRNAKWYAPTITNIIEREGWNDAAA